MLQWSLQILCSVLADEGTIMQVIWNLAAFYRVIYHIENLSKEITIIKLKNKTSVIVNV